MMRGASVDSDDEDNEDDDLIDDRVDLLNAVCMAASKFILKVFPLEVVIEDDELTMVEEEGLDSCISLAHVDVFITVVVC